MVDAKSDIMNILLEKVPQLLDIVSRLQESKLLDYLAATTEDVPRVKETIYNEKTREVKVIIQFIPKPNVDNLEEYANAVDTTISMLFDAIMQILGGMGGTKQGQGQSE